MSSVKVIFVAFLVLAAYACLISAQHGHAASSYTSVHKVHAGQFDYNVVHAPGPHGSFSGRAHPHGYGGFGVAPHP